MSASTPSSELSLPPSVTRADGSGGLPCVRVATPLGTGEVYLQGATVTAWTPAGADPVLFLSEHSRYEPGVAIRGGVPLCAPWFGPGRNKDRSPSHGFFRINPWELTQARDDDGTVTLTFTLDGSVAPEDYPRDFTATYVVTFGRDLGLALTIQAGGHDLDVEEALHSYFRVSDIAEVTIDGLDGSRYADKAPGGRAVNAQSGRVSFSRETDRVYAHEGTATIVDPGAGRTITVTKEGSGSTVVWNPWTAKAAALPDLGDDEWRQMVCVETANALRAALTVAAGTAHTMRGHIAVERL